MKKIAVLAIVLFTLVAFNSGVEAKQKTQPQKSKVTHREINLPVLDFPMIIVIGDEEMIPVHTTGELIGIIAGFQGKDIDFEIVVRERDIKKADKYLKELGL